MMKVQKLLRQEAEKYQLSDGSPGILAYNCWGWRNIALTLRRIADELDIHQHTAPADKKLLS